MGKKEKEMIFLNGEYLPTIKGRNKNKDRNQSLKAFLSGRSQKRRGPFTGTHFSRHFCPLTHIST